MRNCSVGQGPAKSAAGILASSAAMRPGLSKGPPVRKSGSTRGLRLGINPDSHPWADAADGGPEAR